MKILLVIDQFDHANNGTTISAMRFYNTLIKHGHEVKVVSTGKYADYKYQVKERYLPSFARKIVREQGMTLASPDKKIFRKAMLECDIVHFLMPFRLSKSGVKMAEELHVPHTAAFHVQPENISYNIGLGKLNLVNDFIYHYFKNSFYSRFRHIHCPSEFIAGELKKHHYQAKLHVISNGVDDDFVYRKMLKEKPLENKFVILMIGRLSNEKRQDIIIEAVKQTKYQERIQLVLAGKGPNEKKYKEAGLSLKNPPIIGFYDKAQLLKLIGMSDLYVHAADVEIEAISCIEAFSSGLVPVISNSEKSATTQFALDERSLFLAGDSRDLAKKIEYWIEHEEERKTMEYRYSEHGKQYNIDACVNKIEDMFRMEIAEYRN